jgi:hypothetical protein
LSQIAFETPSRAEVVQQSGAAYGSLVVLGSALQTGRFGGDVGYAARVPGEVGRLQVDQVGHPLEHLVEVVA